MLYHDLGSLSHSLPQRGAGAQESRLSIADSGAGARGGGSAPESAAADEGAAEQENERDVVGEKAGKDSALVLGPGSRRLCVAEKEHERDGTGQKDVPSEHSRPNACLGLVHTRVQTHAPPCGEEGLGRSGEGKGAEGATGGGEAGGNTDNRGAKGKMAKRCEGGLKRGDRKERDKRQIKGNHIFKSALSSDFI